MAGLSHLLTGHIQLGIEAIRALAKYLPFTLDIIGVIIEFFGEAEHFTRKLGLESCRLGQLAEVLNSTLTKGGGEAGIIKLHQRLAGLNLLPFFDENLFQNTAFEVLHHLQA